MMTKIRAHHLASAGFNERHPGRSRRLQQWGSGVALDATPGAATWGIGMRPHWVSAGEVQEKQMERGKEADRCRPRTRLRLA